MRSPLEFRRRGGGSFDIASTNPSAYYDRTNLATLFQDSAGTTPVTADSQPIGLGLDQSQGLELGPELVISPYTGVPAGDWVISANSIERNGTTTYNMYINIGSVSSKYVIVEFDLADYSGDTFTVKVGTGVIAGNILTAGHKKFMLPSGAGGEIYFIPWNGTAGQATITNISVKEIKGNHQSQADAGKLPLTAGSPIYANFDAVDDVLVATFPASLGAGCTVCRSLPGTGASITTGVTLTATYTDDVDAHFLAIYTAAQWAALDAGQIANITALLNAKAGL